MSIVDTAKDIYELAKKSSNIELQEKLIRMREEALSLQEENLSLRQQIMALESKLSNKQDLYFDGCLYWRIHDDESKEGPFCQHCFDDSEKMVRLQDASFHGDGGLEEYWDCKVCKSGFSPK